MLDTEVYSNTGGQASKATPLGAVAKFAMGGKDIPKKDLGLMAMAYGHVYVAQVAFGAKDSQTVRAFLEAESYHGPSLIIAYSHCIAHGYNMADGLDHQKAAVESGAWPLYRFDPRRDGHGREPAQARLEAAEDRLRAVRHYRDPLPDAAEDRSRARQEALVEAQRSVTARVDVYKQLASLSYGSEAGCDTN